MSTVNPSAADSVLATEFWHGYHDGRILSLTRSTDEYRGVLIRRLLIPSHASTDPGKLLAAHDLVDFAIPVHDIRMYDFGRDVHFSVGVYHRFADALAAIIDARLMAHATLPNWDQLRLAWQLLGLGKAPEGLEYKEFRASVVRELRAREVDPSAAITTLDKLSPCDDEYSKFRCDGDLDHLHTERQLILKALALSFGGGEFHDALWRVIANRSAEYDDTVGIAVWALGRLNHKAAIPRLVDLLDARLSGRLATAVERALQVLCSGSDLIPLAPDAEPSAYWREQTTCLPTTDEAWAERDALGARWEKRLRCAVEWSTLGRYTRLLDLLRTDEVAPVSTAAISDLAVVAPQPSWLARVKGLLTQGVYRILPLGEVGGAPPPAAVEARPLGIRDQRQADESAEQVWRVEVRDADAVWLSSDPATSSDKRAVIEVAWMASGLLHVGVAQPGGLLQMGEGYELRTCWLSSDFTPRAREAQSLNRFVAVLKFRPIDGQPPRAGDLLVLDNKRLTHEAGWHLVIVCRF